MMEEEETDEWRTALEELFYDFVAMEKCEAMVIRLLAGKEAEWIPVLDLARRSGIDLSRFEEVAKYTHVVWLKDPEHEPGYVTIVCFDRETFYSECAHYNRDHLAAEIEKLNSNGQT